MASLPNSFLSLNSPAAPNLSLNSGNQLGHVVKSTGNGFGVYGAAGDVANTLLGKPASSAAAIAADFKKRIPSLSGDAPR